MKYNYKAFEKQALKEFRELYPEWAHLKTKNLCICDDGEIYFGSMQFKINSKLSDFEIYTHSL